MTNRETEGGVYALMGVNGTGKSTLATRLAERIPKTGVVHASHELRTLFGGISREQQNRMPIEDRLGEIATHLTTVFDRGLNDNERLIFDTQLLVPVAEKPRRYESAWSDQYGPYLASAAMLLSSPESIRAWRYDDEMRTGRQRDLSETNIDRDQQTNLEYYNALVEAGSLPPNSSLINNEAGKIDQTEHLLMEHILNH